MKTDMKKGWEIKKLVDVCIVERGSSPRLIKDYITDDEDGVNWIKIGDTKNIEKYIYKTKQKITKEGAKKSRFVEEGDFILSNSMSFGKPYIVKTKGYIHDGWFKLKLHAFVDTEYFYQLLSSPYVNEQFHSLASGSVVKNISGDLVKKVVLPIPPLPEQQRIVAILNKAFTAIATAKENAQQNLLNAKELFESYLQNVFENKGDDWRFEKLGKLGTLTSSKRIYKKEYVANGVPFYRSKEIKELGNNRDITLELFITEKRYNEIKQKFSIPQKGDILLTAVGTIGEMYIVKENDKFYFKDGNIMWLKNFTTLNAYYLKYALTSFVEKLKALSRGTAYSALTIEKLKEYSIPVPSIKEQQQIVKKLNSLLAETKKIETIYQQKVDDLEELKKSILQKAFNGELTN